MKVTALAGGVGGAKMLVGLRAAASELTAVVNTADDATIYGVHVSPDVDIVTYWLAGIADREKGWGIQGDTFHMVEALRKLGADSWFNLGDRDLATCIYRTARSNDGASLSTITREIRSSLGVQAEILPMSDDPVRTKIVTQEGKTLDFQEYFVRERQEPEVQEVRFAGIETAAPAPGVLDAIRSADRVVLCPSNPVVSIGPILALPGVRNALHRHPDVVAVTPIVRGAPLKGPADRLLPAVGAPVSASGVAGLYHDLVNRFVVDASDAEEAPRVERLGISAVLEDTVMVDLDASERLARALL